ncbi:MAG: acetyl-CoA C-acetyltransferase [Betaproteobacteria bacterium AqS2]|uniref:Acetyl-CoA C-acetyltransferase n=1 Tax=Candidatus Amphirhobacter heronislandensis TaxID=1732024 RepID=A0A930UI89_9GAMM|nr:acetyl-CoA C-acetyltransferase [Betaproteobacteria bacterium AqS2]
MNKPIAIIAAARTPIGDFGGSLAGFKASALGALAIAEVLRRAAIEPAQVSEVVMGQVLTAAVGQNPARQAAIAAELPVEVPAMTINLVCGSGLRAVALGAQAIAGGDAEVVVAGGQESMSQAPHALPGARTGYRLGDGRLVDTMVHDGLWDVFNEYHMGVTAENVAAAEKVGREEQDAYAAESQQKAAAARAAGKFKDEIFAVRIPQRRGDDVVFEEDEFIKPDTSAEKLAKLRTVFKKDGTVTAGNASGINDGAAAMALMALDEAEKQGKEVLAVLESAAVAGLDPKIMGMGPCPASQKALAKAGWQIGDLDLIEANEAFAAQALAVGRKMEWDAAKVNVNGGAIALGHPIGASGCRVATTLLHEMKRSGAKKGLATLCIGGGMGIAACFSNPAA